MSKRRPSYRQGQGQDHDSKGDNSQGRNEERPRERRRNGSRRGPISRVVRGLSERLGVHRHTIIAGFVLGLVFVPMLTLLVFLGALYWVNDPERIEDKLDHLADKARKSYRSHFGGGTSRRHHDDAPPESGTPAGAGAPEGSSDARPNPASPAFVPDFPELRRKFEELETRAAAIETCVASEEFALNRQFRAMGR